MVHGGGSDAQGAAEGHDGYPANNAAQAELERLVPAAAAAAQMAAAGAGSFAASAALNDAAEAYDDDVPDDSQLEQQQQQVVNLDDDPHARQRAFNGAGQAYIKVIGCGGGGGNAIARMITAGLQVRAGRCSCLPIHVC